jgi:hypothetical protein
VTYGIVFGMKYRNPMEFETLFGLENMAPMQCPPRGHVKEIIVFKKIGQ